MIDTSTASELEALAQIEAMEGQPEHRQRLLVLADLYQQRASLALDYSAVLAAAIRLSQARASYDYRLKRSTADQLAEQLERDGVRVWHPYDGDQLEQLREAAATCSRLAATARECARTGIRGRTPSEQPLRAPESVAAKKRPVETVDFGDTWAHLFVRPAGP